MTKKHITKIEDLYIPIPNFRFHHTPSSEEEVDTKFIGRENELAQLREWIKKGKSGNYLVSGHRGMGKTSFVGKALNEIQEKPKKKKIIYLYYVFCVFVFMLMFVYCLLLSSQTPNKNLNEIISSILEFVSVSVSVLVFVLSLLAFFCFCKQKKANNYIISKINLGHEVLNERDILSLIATNIYDKYKEYIHSFEARGWFTKIWKISKHILFCGFAAFCLYVLIRLFENFHFRDITKICKAKDITFLSSIYFFIAKTKCFIEHSLCLPYIFNLFAYAGLFFTIRFLWYKIGSLFYVFQDNSKTKILLDLEKLLHRVDSVVSEDSGPNATATVNPIIGINLFKRKSKQYPLASVRELESELLSILERISKPTLSFFKSLDDENTVPKLVIVFDELDKIDPEYNYQAAKTPEQPEFEKSNAAFSGGMASRSRKQNVLKLMGNMKLFISSAKAKFIFISGRELYDAYLADLSDREFAVSSIFNGVIYVDSFFESNEASKNITSKTEEYICKQLFPKNYIKDNGEEKECENNKKYNFRDYHQFLKKAFRENQEEKDFIIEKIIFFLSQFSVYLSHISNGSPKKIALYFEKYITTISNIKNIKKDDEAISPIIKFYQPKGNKYAVSDDTYCLSFNIPEQRSIGFVHYMIFPIVQATINRASQFNDKLLVSASFLIDHIFKHHIGGFSRDNIEHIPELMEVYRTPEMRHFIDSILSFMRQSHLTTIFTGLYHYKFRKSISDEIRYYSKISEEVSAIFNFTLDESLPVKKYYTKEIEVYNQRYLQFQQNQNQQSLMQINPYVIPLIQMYEILAELQLLDEELDEAITNFQNGLQLIKNELFLIRKNEFVEQNHLHLLILLIKNILKLGLTHENQRTYNSAYALYCELMNYLVHFRYIDEENDLGLDFARQYDGNSYKTYQPVLYYDKYFSCYYKNDDAFHKNVFPQNYENINKNHINYQVAGDTILPQFADPLMPKKHNIITKLTMFDDVRFIYQVILAKLFVIEKIDLTGITQTNLDIAEQEFNYMNLFTNSKDKFILAADFYRKLGAIMYLKNGNTTDMSIILKYWRIDLTELIEQYCTDKNDFEAKQILYKFFKNANLYKFRSYNDFLSALKDIAPYILRERTNPSEIDSPCNEIIDEIRKYRKTGKYKQKEFDIIYNFISYLTEECKNKIVLDILENAKKAKFKRCHECSIHSYKLWKNQHYIPCYGCYYYSKSLDVLRTMFPDSLWTSYEHKKNSRVFGFLEGIKKIAGQPNNIRSSNLLLIGDTLRGIGDVSLSCSYIEKQEQQQSKFNVYFPEMLEKEEKEDSESDIIYENLKKNYQPHCKLEKSILYYYTAAKYYRKAGALLDSVECMKKILQIFITYIKLNNCNEYFETENLNYIKKYIVRKSIDHIHRANSHINLSEIQNQKWMSDKKWDETIILNHLSNYPDVQSLIFLYYELALANGNMESRDKVVYEEFIKSISLSSYRIENTVSQRIQLLIFKAMENKREIYKDLQIANSTFIYQPDTYIIFTEKIATSIRIPDNDFLPIPSNDRLLWDSCNILGNELLSLLHTIIDSIYCLTQVAEILYSSKLNKYSNSFIADNYHELYKWVSMYIILQALMTGKDTFLDMAERSINSRANDNEKQNYRFRMKKLYEDYPFLNAILHKDCEKLLLEKIGEGFRHFLAPNYAAEMAVRYYRKAIEANSGGQTYKDMIADIFLLDDDINNPDLTFALALERYLLNSGDIEKKIKQLRDCYKNATYFDMDHYITGER
jgi:exonuclease VII small subunit